MEKSKSMKLKGIKKKEPTKLIRIPGTEGEDSNVPSILKEYERLQKENIRLKLENETLQLKDENDILQLSNDIFDNYDEIKIKYIIRDDDGEINSEREKVLKEKDNLTEFFNNLKTIPNEEKFDENGYEKKINIKKNKTTLFGDNLLKSKISEKEELFEKEKELIENKKSLKSKINKKLKESNKKDSILFGDNLFVDSIIEFGEKNELNSVLNKFGVDNIPIEEISNQKEKENELKLNKKEISVKLLFDLASDQRRLMEKKLLKKAIYKMLNKKPPINPFEVLRKLISDFKIAQYVIKKNILHYYKRKFFESLKEEEE